MRLPIPPSGRVLLQVFSSFLNAPEEGKPKSWWGKKIPPKREFFASSQTAKAADLLNWCPEEDSNLHTIAGART